jgi:acetolactate synthase-1/2/3 large subunit
MSHAKEKIKEFLKDDNTMLMECIVDPMDLVK